MIGERRRPWCRWSVEVYRSPQARHEPPMPADLVSRRWFATKRGASRFAARYRHHPYISAIPRGPHHLRRPRPTWPSAI